MESRSWFQQQQVCCWIVILVILASLVDHTLSYNVGQRSASPAKQHRPVPTETQESKNISIANIKADLKALYSNPAKLNAMIERISGGFKKSSGENKWDLNDKNSPQYDKKVLSEIYSDPEALQERVDKLSDGTQYGKQSAEFWSPPYIKQYLKDSRNARQAKQALEFGMKVGQEAYDSFNANVARQVEGDPRTQAEKDRDDEWIAEHNWTPGSRQMDNQKAMDFGMKIGQEASDAYNANVARQVEGDPRTQAEKDRDDQWIAEHNWTPNGRNIKVTPELQEKFNQEWVEMHGARNIKVTPELQEKFNQEWIEKHGARNIKVTPELQEKFNQEWIEKHGARNIKVTPELQEKFNQEWIEKHGARNIKVTPELQEKFNQEWIEKHGARNIKVTPELQEKFNQEWIEKHGARNIKVTPELQEKFNQEWIEKHGARNIKVTPELQEKFNQEWIEKHGARNIQVTPEMQEQFNQEWEAMNGWSPDTAREIDEAKMQQWAEQMETAKASSDPNFGKEIAEQWRLENMPPASDQAARRETAQEKYLKIGQEAAIKGQEAHDAWNGRRETGTEFGTRIGQEASDWYIANGGPVDRREIDEEKKQLWAQQLQMAKSSSDPKFGAEIGQKFHDWWQNNMPQDRAEQRETGTDFGARIGQEAHDWYVANGGPVERREIDEEKKQLWAQQLEMAKSSSDPKFGAEIGQKFHDWWQNNMPQDGAAQRETVPDFGARIGQEAHDWYVANGGPVERRDVSEEPKQGFEIDKTFRDWWENNMMDQQNGDVLKTDNLSYLVVNGDVNLGKRDMSDFGMRIGQEAAKGTADANFGMNVAQQAASEQAARRETAQEKYLKIGQEAAIKGQEAHDAWTGRAIDEEKKQLWAQQLEMAKSSSDPKFGAEIGQKFHDWWQNNMPQDGAEARNARSIVMA